MTDERLDERVCAAPRRLLLVHAHPDDESITTGGTIAKYLEAGAAVLVVTCTLGEEGEVMQARWAQLPSDHGDQLGGYRVGELTNALAALSGSGPRLRPMFLGGVGRWRDSGMAGIAAASHPRAFVSTVHDRWVPGGPVDALVRVIRDFRPQVVVTYDEFGGYGHPDHIAAHTVTGAAVRAAGEPSVQPGSPWEVSKLYWNVLGRNQFENSLNELATANLPTDWTVPAETAMPTYDDRAITTAIDVSGVIARKADAMRCHATQLEVSDGGTAFVLTNRIVQPVLDQELYVLARGEAAPGADGIERDLFAGLT